MEAKQLMFFKRVAELGHMTRAADELMVSQPYLSRTIAALEAELNVKLFDHLGRGIVLNDCGKAFYKRVLAVLNELEDAKKELLGIQNIQQTQLRIVTNVSLYIPGLMQLLVADNTDLKILQISAQRRHVLRMLQSGSADFAICCPPLEETEDLKTIHLRFEPGVVIYPEGHWLEGYDKIELDMLRGENHVSGTKGYGARDALDEYFTSRNIKPLDISIETGETTAVFRYVEKGLGIAVMPLAMVLQEGSFKDRYTRLDGSAGGRLAMTWRSNKYISDLDRLFIEKTQEYFEHLESFVEKHRSR